MAGGFWLAVTASNVESKPRRGLAAIGNSLTFVLTRSAGGHLYEN
jgi:hypothetical protein